jgi:hypothetical protein
VSQSTVGAWFFESKIALPKFDKSKQWPKSRKEQQSLPAVSPTPVCQPTRQQTIKAAGNQKPMLLC